MRSDEIRTNVGTGPDTILITRGVATSLNRSISDIDISDRQMHPRPAADNVIISFSLPPRLPFNCPFSQMFRKTILKRFYLLSH